MKIETNWIAACTAALWMGCIAAARADIFSVVPAEGTLGSRFTITGLGLGEKRGKIQLGDERCRVLSWSDTQITCEVEVAQPAGDYPVTLTPQGSAKKSTSQTYSPFVLRKPEIHRDEPLRLVTPLEVVTITGDFFGDKAGQVGLRDTTGVTLEARVFDWSMNSITFEVPAGLTGMAHLGVKNDVGLGIHPYWCTFTPLPPDLPQATRTYSIGKTQANARGIFFNSELWIFFPKEDASGVNQIAVRKFNYKDGSVSTVPSSDNPGGQTDTQLAPIVIDHELWLFDTGQSGQLFHKRYTIVDTDPVTKKPIYGWENTWHRIGALVTDGDLAPAWDPIKNRLEVFYWYSDSIYRVYSDDKGITWQAPNKVEGLGTVSAGPSAVFWQQSGETGVTLLGIAGLGNPDINDTTVYAKVYAVQDGRMVGTGPLWWSLDHSSRPFLADLDEDSIGLVFENGPLDQVDVAKMNRKTGIWNYNPLVPYLDRNIERAPSVAVNLQEQEDGTAALGVRYNAVAYLFWGDKVTGGTESKLSSVETLGYWKEDSYTDFDSSGESTRPDVFDLWQVVGVVDAPPFVLNGAEYGEECDLWTCNGLTFGNVQIGGTTMTYDMSVGMYFEAGAKSPVEVELSASINAKFEQTKSATVEITTTLFRSKDGVVSVLYLAPEFRTHHVQWYDLSGTPTGNFIEQLEVLKVQLLSQEFDPRRFPWSDLHAMPPTYFGDDFPIHASDPYEYTEHLTEADWEDADWARLGSYTKEQTDSVWFSNPVYWNTHGEKHLKWVLSEETTKEAGFEVEYKVGVQVGEYFGMGTQGSFSVTTTSKVTVENKAELSMVPGLESGQPFDSFRVDGYWLEPNSDGYWVPLNRRGTGDAPWFITYRVSDISEVEP